MTSESSKPRPFSPESAPPPEDHPIADPQDAIDRDDDEKPDKPKDIVQEASEESFPASDPPSFTPTKLLGPPED